MKLARRDFVRSTTYVHFNDLPPGNVHNGGKKAEAEIAPMLVNALQCGFDATAKERFIMGATEALG